MWFHPVYWTGVIGSTTDSVAAGRLYVRPTAFSAVSPSLSFSLAHTCTLSSLAIALHCPSSPPAPPSMCLCWMGMEAPFFSQAEHPRRDALKNVPYVRRVGPLTPTRPAPETRKKQQVFVTACEQDLKFLPLSDAERPWLWPFVVSAIRKWEPWMQNSFFWKRTPGRKMLIAKWAKLLEHPSYKVFVCILPFCYFIRKLSSWKVVIILHTWKKKKSDLSER